MRPIVILIIISLTAVCIKDNIRIRDLKQRYEWQTITLENSINLSSMAIADLKECYSKIDEYVDSKEIELVRR